MTPIPTTIDLRMNGEANLFVGALKKQSLLSAVAAVCAAVSVLSQTIILVRKESTGSPTMNTPLFERKQELLALISTAASSLEQLQKKLAFNQSLDLAVGLNDAEAVLKNLREIVTTANC